MKFDIWSEGFQTEPECEGHPVPAKLLHSEIEGDDFFDACRNWAKDFPDECNRCGGLEFVSYADGNVWPTCWCCRLFDNETDARKSFG